MRREHETAGGVEVERLVRGPDLADDGADGGTPRRFDRRAQRRDGITSLHQQHGTGIDADGIEPFWRKGAEFAAHVILTGPHDGASHRGAPSQRGGKTSGRSGVCQALGNKLMQGGLK